MAQPDPIRVLVVDDQRPVRRGLAISLSIFDDIRLIGEATDGAEAIQLCQKTNPDVILMDLQMPGMDGILATTQIKQFYPHVQIIIFTNFIESPLIKTALQAGASCCLIKTVSIDELAETIRNVNNVNGQFRDAVNR